MTPASVKLVKGFPFIGGHLLQHVSPEKEYKVLGRHATHLKIEDDSGKVIWLSGNVQREFFHLNKEQKK